MSEYKFITRESAHRLLNNRVNKKDPYSIWLNEIVEKIRSGEYKIKRYRNNLGEIPALVEIWGPN